MAGEIDTIISKGVVVHQREMYMKDETLRNISWSSLTTYLSPYAHIDRLNLYAYRAKKCLRVLANCVNNTEAVLQFLHQI